MAAAALSTSSCARNPRLRTQFFEIKDEGTSDTNGGEEGVGTAVIAHGDTPPVFEMAEHVLDFVAFFVEFFIIQDAALAVFARRDTGEATPLFFKAFLNQSAS
jgi:hypothetical protein